MRKAPTNSGNGQKKSIEKYLQEIVLFTPLPPEEEIKLTRSVRKGESLALDELIKTNLRFVVSIAKQYQDRGLALEDLISEGNVGLINAAQRFDETRGFKFITYAVWWIRQAILQALAEQTRMVRLPMKRVGAIHKVGKVLEKLQSQQGREAGSHEVADCLEMTDDEVTDILQTAAHHLSLDGPLKQEDGSCLLDVLENQQDAAPDEFLMQESLKEEIHKILATLKPREAEIIRLYFGLQDGRALTVEEIAECIKLPRQRIRQIKDNALRRLRQHIRSKPLRNYLG